MKRTPAASDAICRDGRIDFEVINFYILLMSKSTPGIADLLHRLTQQARAAGLTDTAWAFRAGVRKETLSRLRGRQTCDLATLSALAEVVGSRVAIVDAAKPESPVDNHFPSELDRDYEDKLLELCASRTLDVARWSSLGPRFFMAGLAVMLASTAGFDRPGLLALADKLHPGASEPAVFARWLKSSPVRPSRFLPSLDAAISHAA